jgi:SET domain-containing protein
MATLKTIDPAHAPFRLAVRRSRIHRRGVFARERIPAGRKVIEFTGEHITFQEARRRWNPALNYLFALDENLIIDGSAGGSGAEYVNHSCAPNLRARYLRGHLLYFSTRSIQKGEELTVDYRYAGGGRQTYPCRCGASSCRGTMILTRRDARGSRAPRRAGD